MPQSGRMALWQMPDGIRVEHALQSGSEIPPFYDSMIAKLISHGADPRRGAAQADLRPRTDRRVRRHHQSGVSDRLPAPSRLCRGRGDHGVHRQASRRAAGAARGRRRRKRRWRRCCSMSPIPMRRPGGADGRWRRRFRFRCGSSSIMASTSSKSCASAMAAMSRAVDGERAALRDRRTRRRHHPLPHRRPDGIGKILARRRPALFPAPRRHAFGPRSDAWPRRPRRRRPAATARFARR